MGASLLVPGKPGNFKEVYHLERMARNNREAKLALEFAQLHDLANHNAYHLRRVAVWGIKGNPSVVGLAGRKWGFDDRRKLA